ncbi:uncharacterized protein LOC110721052 [Chenopodium quinoa]|uniref:uncharacterized protein LOC110721052 n=1 Tax=Chenopodium quinoa TaxID=63459 RepID=UPI000B76FCE8|nr:uncharacterized protein LOC110721052 [Chenopodium quinoa]
MDCSPPFSPPMEDTVVSSPSKSSACSPLRKVGNKLKTYSSLKLRKSGEKMWEWVKQQGPRKCAGGALSPSSPPLPDDQQQQYSTSPCLSCFLPYKKRKADVSSISLESSEGSVTSRERCVVRKLASLPFLGCCGIDADGLSGGMFICWFTPLGLVPVYSSQNVYLCKLVQGDEIKHVMFVYGSPHVTNRSEIWYLISNIIESLSNVIIIGDFNQVEYFSDKLGGNLSIPGQMEFINWRMGLDLVDVPFSGPRYTWTNNRLDSDPIFERLDRAYASPTWFLEYPDTRLTHQPILFSDHAAIILADSVDSVDIKRLYKIENWCLSVPAIHDIISSKAWGINWKQLVFDIHQASRFLDTRVDRCLFISTKNEKVAEAQAAYIFWQQQAKIKWDALGDSHFVLLFYSIQSRKRNNRIFGLRDSNGEWHRNPDQIASITQAFYKDLFTTSASASSYDEEWWDSLQLPSLTSQ